MFHQREINMRHVWVYTITVIFLMVILPYISIKIFPEIMKHQLSPPYEGVIPKTVKVYISEEEAYQRIPFEQYIQGVVASEMPSSFSLEALKAQSVASRTYALGRIKAGTKLCDTTHCQVYRSANIHSKVRKAVKATKGQVLLHKGQLASHALYFASSGGKTENSQDVFSGTFAYLSSVSSSYEPGATHKKEVKTLSITSFANKVKKSLPEYDFGAIKKNNIHIKSRSEGGRVKEIKVGQEVLSGTDIRTALGLYSTRFNLSFKGKNITFTTSGSGHGVGMSQYGANGLGKKGKDYRSILSHYYQHTSVSE